MCGRPSASRHAGGQDALAAAAVAGFVSGLDMRRLQRCAEGAGLGAVDGRRGAMEPRLVAHLLPDVHSLLSILADTPLPELQVNLPRRGGSAWGSAAFCGAFQLPSVLQLPGAAIPALHQLRLLPVRRGPNTAGAVRGGGAGAGGALARPAPTPGPAQAPGTFRPGVMIGAGCDGALGACCQFGPAAAAAAALLATAAAARQQHWVHSHGVIRDP